MLQYKVIRTKYSSIDYAKPETIEERLNEAAKEGWRVEKAMSSHLGDARSIVETYLLSKDELTDEECIKIEDTFRALKDIHFPIETERNQAMAETLDWVYGNQDTLHSIP